MSWASGRRIIIGAVLAVVVLLIAAIVGFLVFSKAPSCTDNRQNGGETGIDCGGPCARACSADTLAPVISFARALRVSDSRTDLIATIGNPNRTFAAKNVPFTASFHDANGEEIGTKKGVIDIPPDSSVAVYVPNAYSGTREVTQTFFSFDATPEWYRLDTPLNELVIGDSRFSGADEAPRVVTSVKNPSVTTIPQTRLVVTVFDASGNAIAASQTVVPPLQAEGTAEATFTWNAPFSAPGVTIKVVPVITLP